MHDRNLSKKLHHEKDHSIFRELNQYKLQIQNSREQHDLVANPQSTIAAHVVITAVLQA